MSEALSCMENEKHQGIFRSLPCLSLCPVASVKPATLEVPDDSYACETDLISCNNQPADHIFFLLRQYPEQINRLLLKQNDIYAYSSLFVTGKSDENHLLLLCLKLQDRLCSLK